MKIPATSQKLRGGYYTPEPISQFLAEWAIEDRNLTVLEPSCGDGNIIEAAASTLLKKGSDTALLQNTLFAVEIDPVEASKTLSRLSDIGVSMKNMIVGDFFGYCRDSLLENRKFDVVLGNPPFIRYQHFQEEQRSVAFKIMQHAGLKPTRLTNAWVPFLVASTLLLKDHGGKIGMVIPAELLQVNYAAELRRFLSDHYSRITLFSFKKLVFSGIQQEVVLFLGEKNGNDRTGIRVVELDSMDDLITHKHTDFAHQELRDMDHSKDKWTQYFLSQKEIDILRSIRAESGIPNSGTLVDVDVGIVTGLNDFFILSDDDVRKHELFDFVRPIVTKSAHLQGLHFTEKDFRRNKEQQLQCWLLDIPRNVFPKLPDAVLSYIAFGERMEYNTGYKCRIRDEWYVVPSIWVPDAFMLRQIHYYPKVILNNTKATSTDTIHRVRMRTKLPLAQVTSAFINSITFAFTETVGRSYGGGVLELEPNEAEILPIPVRGLDLLDIEQINTLLIDGKVQEALDINDKILLSNGYGLSNSDILAVRTIWSKLRDRRIHRKHAKRSRSTV